ncbi:MAG TPA: DNA/RNA helicase domain-containing protein [Candidatus Wunengus sp. YC60]|uniref:DNA/RNA helicase domain-containing protein n=1 Tax=Candidatus Wunengus sp. YC60 TaxID=3367697 RepID=UPI004027F729
MELYSGTIQNFVTDTLQNQIATKLEATFFEYFGYKPSEAEVRSWRSSLRAVKDVFEYSGFHDHGVFLEYQLPLSSKRLDCMICGRDSEGRDNSVIIELKQWETAQVSEVSEHVITWIGGANRDVLHPSVQVGQYKLYLEDNQTAFFEKDPVLLHACAYVHNYVATEQDALFAFQYASYLRSYPVYCEKDVKMLSEFLRSKLDHGNGMPVLQRIRESKYGPSKKLLDEVVKVVKENKRYILLDDQFLAFDSVMSLVRIGEKSKRKTVVIVNGGPGTGKSVVAINLLAELSRMGKNAQYATGSKAFTETLRKALGPTAKSQIKYFNSYTKEKVNTIDVLVADESHRLRLTSNNRFTKKELRSTTPQIEELINVAKVPVFFIDDRQNVRPKEIGSSNYIRENAQRLGCDVSEYNLDIQFRCQGSDKFVQWVNNTFAIKKTAEAIWDSKDTEFDFQIVSSPHQLYDKIKKKNDNEANSARLVAGFCWPWSEPKEDGTLVADVVIEDFAMTWEGKESGRKLAPSIPPASLWPFDPRAVNQIGSIYTIQGFEFDYVGVIIGKDFIFNFETNQWEGHPEFSADSTVRRDKEKFLDLVKNTYRVLLSRALKGCYVYFVDKETEKFVRSRME